LKNAIEIGGCAGEGGAYGNLGNAYFSLGDFRRAIEYHQKGLKIAIEIGDRAREGLAYGNLGIAYFSLGDFRKAIQYNEQRLKIAIEIGDRVGEGGANGNLGIDYESLGGPMGNRRRSYHGVHEKLLPTPGGRKNRQCCCSPSNEIPS